MSVSDPPGQTDLAAIGIRVGGTATIRTIRNRRHIQVSVSGTTARVPVVEHAGTNDYVAALTRLIRNAKKGLNATQQHPPQTHP